jgi:hypothetical protein
MYVREGMEREEIALPFRSSHWMMGNMQLRKRKKWDRNQDGLVHVLEHKPISPLLFSVGGEGEREIRKGAQTSDGKSSSIYAGRVQEE